MAESKATPEVVWQILREVGELQKETARERKKTEAERRKTEESFQRLQEAQKKTEETLNKTRGDFTCKWGDFMESLIQGDLQKLLRERGIAVEKILRKVSVGRSDKTVAMEFDLVAVNGKEVVVVEVKTTLTGEKIDKFIKRLENFRAIFPEYKERKIYGCVAYLGEHKESARESEENGLFVIKALEGASNISTIVNPPDFRPRLF